MTSISGDVIAKRLQMIKEVVPALDRVALLVRESSPDTAQYVGVPDCGTESGRAAPDRDRA